MLGPVSEEAGESAHGLLRRMAHGGAREAHPQQGGTSESEVGRAACPPGEERVDIERGPGCLAQEIHGRGWARR